MVLDTLNLAAGVMIVVALLILIKMIRIVPQGSQWIVERLGRYHTLLQPGLSIIIPFVDRVAYKVSTKDIQLKIPTQEVITKDNALILINAISFIRVTDTHKVCYAIEDYRGGVENLITTNLRSIVGTMELDQSLSSRKEITAQLVQNMESSLADWGVTLRSADIQDIQPGKNMQEAMERQASSERLRRAMETEAAGKKQAAILEAEGRKESAIHNATGEKQAAILAAEARQEAARHEAAAQLALADATAESIRRIGEAARHAPEAVTYLLGERQIKAIGELASSDNAKTLMMPLELTESLKTFTTSANVLDDVVRRNA